MTAKSIYRNCMAKDLNKQYFIDKKLFNVKNNKLTIISELCYRFNHRIYVLVRCDCIKEFWIRLDCLRSGQTKSCGCIRNKHNGAKNGKSRLYLMWQNMKKRCYNKNATGYHNYGGRGIIVCDEWHDFTNFQNWSYNNNYDDSLQIDRIDTNQHYEPNNCRFATRSQNCSNKRSITNTSSQYKGVTKRKNKWIAAIKKNKKTNYIGIYNTEVEAALAYNKVAIELHGEYAHLNIIENNYMGKDHDRN